MIEPAESLAEPQRPAGVVMEVQPAATVYLGCFGTYRIGSQRYDRNGRQIGGQAGETGMVLDGVMSALPGPVFVCSCLLDGVMSALPGPVFVCSCLLGGGADVVVPANDRPAAELTARTTHHASHAAALQFALAESNLISGVDE